MSDEFTVQQLAEIAQGQIEGDGQQIIRGAAPLSDAGPEHITFLDAQRSVSTLADCNAAAVVVSTGMEGSPPDGQTWIRVKEPLSAFIGIVQHMQGIEEPQPHGIDPLASVHPSVQMGPDCSVHPFAVIGEGSVLGARCRIHPGVVIGRNCKLGDDVTLHPHVVLYDNTILGNRVIGHAGTVLGADGFGYRFQGGMHVKVPQLGRVQIGDDVEIGASSAIDRATFGATLIGEGTKIDNLVQIGHNCTIGAHNIFAGQVGMAGSCSTGNYVILAGQVGIADHLHIGEGAKLGAQAGLVSDVAPGEIRWGTPAINSREQKKILVYLRKLPEMKKEIEELRRQLEELLEQKKGAA